MNALHLGVRRFLSPSDIKQSPLLDGRRWVRRIEIEDTGSSGIVLQHRCRQAHG